MTEPSRRSIPRTAVLGGAVTGGAVPLSAGQAQAADRLARHKPAASGRGLPSAARP